MASALRLYWVVIWGSVRSEEHTSELQSRLHLVCRLLLEKKKNHYTATIDFILSVTSYYFPIIVIHAAPLIIAYFRVPQTTLHPRALPATAAQLLQCASYV